MEIRLDTIRQQLAQVDIELHISKKRVKNINFRLKPHVLMVSVPLHISDSQAADAVARRVSWAINHHPQVLEQHQRKQGAPSDLTTADQPIYLWGKVQALTLSHGEKVAYYRQQLSDVMPSLFEKWQPIVGTYANEIRVKKMHTRWGSCNTRAKRIWLSVYLPAYPGKRWRVRCQIIGNGIIYWQARQDSWIKHAI